MVQEALIETPPDRGHNRPPELIDMVTSDPAVLQARLDVEYRGMAARFIELEIGAKKAPVAITTEEQAKTTTDWVGQQCKVLLAEAEAAHAKEKKPYLLPGRMVDRFFLDRVKRLKNVIGPIERRVQKYYDLKKAEIRQREEAQRRAAIVQREKAEAERVRLATAAQQAEAEGDRGTAIELTRMAEHEATTAAVAAAQAVMPPASVAIRGDYGSSAFSVEYWTFDRDSIDPSLIPLGYLTVDEKAVQEAIDEGIREIPGLRIFKTSRFTIKRC